jgi:hypothetical protein
MRLTFRLPTLKEFMIAAIFVAFLFVDTDHDWRVRVGPYLHMTEWTVIFLKLSILSVALYRSYCMTYGLGAGWCQLNNDLIGYKP